MADEKKTSPTDSKTIEQARLVPGTDIRKIANLDYLMRLMASVEALRAGIRWFQLTQGAKSDLARRDVIMATIAVSGWCAETFHCIKDGIRKEIIAPERIKGPKGKALLDRITSESPDELIGRIYRARDKYFAHWDASVFRRFVDWQTSKASLEPIWETDMANRGGYLDSRYTWPWLAFMIDFFQGDPTNEADKQRISEMLQGLGPIWNATSKLVGELIGMIFESQGLRLEFVPNEEGDT